MTTTRIPSTDDVVVAVHDLGGPVGAPLVLVAHATGFHARAYLPMAAALAPRFHTVGLDFRGHGDTEAPEDWHAHWDHYGDDAVAVGCHVAAQPGGARGLIGFGHSKGGAALLMAAHRQPGCFRLLVLFEPIVTRPPAPGAPRPEKVMSANARRRRAVFPSFDDALANYASKPPLDAFHPAALEAYVRYGFVEDPATGGVRLKCDPEHEARTFEMGAHQDTWDLLPDITIPVVVVAGRIEGLNPAARAAGVAEALPAGRLVSLPQLDHFGPMTHPRLVADLIVDAADRLDGPG